MKVSNAPLKNKGNHNLGNSVVVLFFLLLFLNVVIFFYFYYRSPDNFLGTFLTISLIRKKWLCDL